MFFFIIKTHGTVAILTHPVSYKTCVMFNCVAIQFNTFIIF